MKTPKRIDLSLFDDNLKTLISASTKIFPVEYSYIQAGTNPQNYEYVKVMTAGPHRLEIYTWVDNGWHLIGADDKSVAWSDIQNTPESYPPSAHTHNEYALTDHTHAALHSHTNKTLLDSLAQTDLDKWNNYLETLTDHEQRLQLIEGGYSAGHAHTNLAALNKITYSGTLESIDLKAIADNTAAIGLKADIADLASKAEATTVSGHTGNSTIHVTQTNKDNWNAKTKISITGTQPTDSSLWFKTL